jgi:hypothetical protein
VKKHLFDRPLMSLGRTSRQARRRILLIALTVFAAGVAAAEPALAQYYWGGGRYYGGNRYYPPAPPRDFFYPFSGFMRPPPVADSTKAPSSRKLETPPTSTVVVVGDSMADWLGYGLDEIYADQPDIGIERKIRPSAGLIRYDSKNEALDWPQTIKEALANGKPNAIVVMLGLNDRAPLRDKAPPQPSTKRIGDAGQGQGINQGANQPANPPGQASQDKTAAPADTEAPPQAAAQNETPRPVPGGSYDFHTDQWATLYAKRIDEMIAALKSKGVPVIWVGLPAIRGTKSTSDMGYLDELYRGRAEKAGIAYVDIWDGFVDDQGRYAVQGPDFEGQIRRLRTADGVHFTKAGAVKLASFVERELRRLMSIRGVPVALPAPEGAPKSGAAGARPDVGPVLPLSASGGDGGDLAGGGGRATQAISDPLAMRVLTRGDPLPAAAGRADDFSWPRPGAGATATPDTAPPPAALTPAAPPRKPARRRSPLPRPGKTRRVNPAKTPHRRGRHGRPMPTSMARRGRQRRSVRDEQTISGSFGRAGPTLALFRQ